MANRTLSDEDQLAGNAEDSLNPGSDRSKELFNKKGNAVSDDLASLEADLDKKYSQDFDAVDNNNDRQVLKENEENPEQPKSLYSKDSGKKKSGLSAKLLAGAKRFGPTGGVIGIVLAALGITSGFAGPASLLVALSDLTSNHTGLSNHLFLKSGSSYVASFIKGETRDCSQSKIKCKFTTISEERKAEWEKRGIKVDAPTKNSLGRYIVRGLEYKNTPVRTIRDYKNLRYTDPEFNSLLKKYPVRAYLLEKSPFRRGTLPKFNVKLSDKFTSSKDKDKQKRVEENNKAMNEKVQAPVDESGKVSAARTKDEAKPKVDNASASSKDKLKSVKTAFKVASGVSTGTIAACMAYNVVRATQAAITLYWHTKLIEFAVPFLEAGAQAKEAGVNNGFDWETAEYFGDRLTQPITQKDIDADPSDDITQDMLGKTAMDSKGIDAVINGSSANINDPNNYASKYNGWAPNVLGIGVVRQLQNIIGTDNIATACQSAKVIGYLSTVACLAGPAAIIKCLFTIGAYEGLVKLFGSDVLTAITDKLEGPALDAIASANLSSSLHGPPLGQALVSATGVMSSYMDNASGFTYAGTDSQAITAYNNMYGDDEYIAEMKSEAAKDQFNTSNPYSFASLALSKFTNMNWDGTGYSALANIIKAAVNSPLLATNNAFAMQQGLYQPVEIYSSTEKIQGTLNNCQNPGLKNVSIPCLGESGRAVPTFMPNVESCMAQEAIGGQLCIERAIDYLSIKKKYTVKDENGKEKEVPIIDKDSGEPTDFSNYKPDAEEDYDNPFLMFMEYCGRDRVYPLGYTDKDIDSDKDDWHTGVNCVAGKSTDQNVDDETLGWMSYYYHMCIAMYASEENQDYCWDETAIPNNGNVCSLLNNPHIHYEQKATEEDLKKLCAGQSVKSYCGNDIKINQELINTLVSNSKKYDITINNFGFADDRHVSNDCQPGKQHWKGNAVDISKVSLVGSSSGAGNGTYGSVSYAGANGSLLSQYASDFLSGISGNRGGVGQKGCSSTFNPTFPAGSTNVNGAAFFEDSCDHLHIDVRDRTNISGL